MLAPVRHHRTYYYLAGGGPSGLYGPSGAKTGPTTASVSVLASDAGGTVYWIVDESATPPSVAQIQAGQDSGGSAADDAGSETAVAGLQSMFATGLSPNTVYYAHFQLNDGSDGPVLTSAGFTDAQGLGRRLGLFGRRR